MYEYEFVELREDVGSAWFRTAVADRARLGWRFVAVVPPTSTESSAWLTFERPVAAPAAEATPPAQTAREGLVLPAWKHIATFTGGAMGGGTLLWSAADSDGAVRGLVVAHGDQHYLVHPEHMGPFATVEAALHAGDVVLAAEATRMGPPASTLPVAGVHAHVSGFGGDR